MNLAPPSIQHTKTKRVVYRKYTGKSAATLVVMLGIHGNEISGFEAVENMIQTFQKSGMDFKGNVYILKGNIHAMELGKRYDTQDLNRLWTDEQVAKVQRDNAHLNPDEREQREVYATLKEILNNHPDKPIYFVDLHTTSSPTIPFITTSDSLDNRAFSALFPLPVVLGIEAYIHGALLSYISEFGHIGIGFEAGQHNDKNAVAVNEAFLWLSLVNSGCLDKEQIPGYDKYFQLLQEKNLFKNRFFDIVYKYTISKDAVFQMNPGFENFQSIQKNQVLARVDNRVLRSPARGKIFMPLYQAQGEDGYFIMKNISLFWLLISRWLRRNNAYVLLRWIPGISTPSRTDNITQCLRVKPNFWQKKILTLLGYREYRQFEDKICFIRRDRNLRVF